MTRTKKNMAALTVLLSLLAACAAPPPVAHPDVGIELPDGWAAEGVAAGDVRGPWWRTFGDPAIERIVREAIHHNRDLRAAAARVAGAVAQARIAGADTLPQVSAGLNGTRQRQNFIGFPVPGGDDEVFSATFDQFGLSLNVGWELDLWGRLRAAHRAELAQLEAVKADLAAAYLSLTAQSVRAYFAVTEAQKQVELGERAVESYRETAKQVGDRVGAGLAPQLDDRLARADLATSRAAVAQRRATLARERRALEVLLGRYPAGAIPPGATLPAVEGAVPAGIPAEMIARRPDVAAAERRLASAGARVDAARGALYPRLSLTASGGTASEDFSDLLDGDFRVWTLAGNLLQPIFEGGRLRARVAAEKASAKEALEQYANTVLVALAEVETALATEGLLAEQERRLSDAVDRAYEARDLARDRYGLGLDGLLVVLEANRRAIDNEGLLITVRRARLENRIALHLALGGGFEAITSEGRDTKAPKATAAIAKEE